MREYFHGVLVDREVFTLAIMCMYQECGSRCCRGEGLGTPLEPHDLSRLRQVPDASCDPGRLRQVPDTSPDPGRLQQVPSLNIAGSRGNSGEMIPEKLQGYVEYRHGLRLACRPNGDCVFFSSLSNNCSINQWKPDYCILYPIVITENVRGHFRLELESYSRCRFSRSDTPFVFQIANVLRARLGEEWTARLMERVSKDCGVSF